jgi:hypothetical protein
MHLQNVKKAGSRSANRIPYHHIRYSIDHLHPARKGIEGYGKIHYKK